MDNTALVIAIIGAINWGSIGLFGVDLVALLCGGQTAILSKIIYTVVGLAGLWCITLLFKEKLPVKEARTHSH
ncbi:MAG: DUF378 domain-containing protein [Ruminococcaceae bacterium]|nr:DUF378 domain-containing protein [Oscillospiraceae bacterium]